MTRRFVVSKLGWGKALPKGMRAATARIAKLEAEGRSAAAFELAATTGIELETNFGDSKRALTFLEKAHELLAHARDPALKIEVLGSLAECYSHLQQLNEAEASAREFRDAARAEKDQTSLMRAHVLLADVCNDKWYNKKRSQDQENALRSVESGIQLYGTLKNKDPKRTELYVEALCLRGRIVGGEVGLRDMLAAREKAKKEHLHEQRKLIVGHIAAFYDEREEYDNSKEFYDEGIRCASRIGDDAETCRIFWELADNARKCGKSQERIENLRQAKRYARKMGDEEKIAEIEREVSRLQRKLAEIADITAALAANKSLDQQQSLRWRLAARKMAIGSYRDALVDLSIFRDAASGSNRADAAMQIGICLFELRKYKDALEAFAQLPNQTTNPAAALYTAHCKRLLNKDSAICIQAYETAAHASTAARELGRAVQAAEFLVSMCGQARLDAKAESWKKRLAELEAEREDAEGDDDQENEDEEEHSGESSAESDASSADDQEALSGEDDDDDQEDDDDEDREPFVVPDSPRTKRDAEEQKHLRALREAKRTKYQLS